MFQLSLTVLLALSISANFVFAIEVFQGYTTNLQNESPVGVPKNNNQTEESPKLHEESSKNVTKINSTLEEDLQKVNTSQAKNSTITSLTTQNVTGTSSTQNVTRPIEEETPMTEEKVVTQKAGNLPGEQPNVNPPDGNKENVKIVTLKENSTSAGTTPSLIVTTLNSSIASPTTVDNSSSPVEPYPVKDKSNESSDVSGSLNGSIYQTLSPDLGHVTEATTKITNSTVITTITINSITTAAVTNTKAAPTIITTTTTTTLAPTTIITPAIANTTGATNDTTALKNNQTKNGNDRMTVEGVENLQQAELSEKGKESNDGSKNGSMTPGVIALVTTITFAVAIAIGYISMVVWKQYLEHRYGRRELLVNELEFDTNDLRHFEL